LAAKGFIASMSRAGTPTDNPFAERFVGTFKHSVVRRRKYDTLGEFLDAAEEWINFYNGRRPHQGIGLLSPNQKAALLGLPDVPRLCDLTV
jgi:putative transposase